MARSQFYDRLREIRDYHRRYPSADLTEAEDSEALLKEEVAVEFSGEECMGRCLDLVPHHQTFINTKWGAAAGRPDYLAYVSSFADFSSIPRLAKLSAGYREYLAALAAYLMGFHDRTQPLVLLDRQLAKAEEEARGAWAAGTLSGWEDRAAGSSAAAPAPLIDLEAFDSAEELETVGEWGSVSFIQAAACRRLRQKRGWLVHGSGMKCVLLELDPGRVDGADFVTSTRPSSALLLVGAF